MTDHHTGSWAPYAPPSTMLPVLRHLREQDVPQTLSHEYLRQLGINRQGAYRVMRALHFLGLIDDDRTTTGGLTMLQEASTDEYPEVLSRIVLASYRVLFEVIDPTTASTAALIDAFRLFKPASQASEMATLFRALAQEANLTSRQGDGALFAAILAVDYPAPKEDHIG